MSSPHPTRPRTPEICRISQNSDPNVPISDPRQKPRPRERKFILAKKNPSKEGTNSSSEDLKHMVKAFEHLSIQELQQPMRATEAEVSSSKTLSSSELFPDSRAYSSIHSTDDRLSWGSRTCGGGRRSRRDSTDSCGRTRNKKLKITIQRPFELKTESTDSCGRTWNKKLKITIQRPFELKTESTDSCGRSWNKKLKITIQRPLELKTEQRGSLHEEQFIKKLNEMCIKEERKRIPIAQGLPWTTEEPKLLVKPPVKERTEPIDLVLHSYVRAVERAEFDHHIAERTSMAEQRKTELARRRELEEEEEVQRLRRELIPRARLMPHFDRPFIPQKSTRRRTVPKEPRFHVHPMKPSCSWEDGQHVSLCSRRHPPGATHGGDRDTM